MGGEHHAPTVLLRERNSIPITEGAVWTSSPGWIICKSRQQRFATPTTLSRPVICQPNHFLAERKLTHKNAIKGEEGRKITVQKNIETFLAKRTAKLV